MTVASLGWISSGRARINMPPHPRRRMLVLRFLLLAATATRARAQGLVAAYGFDEGAATRVTDISGNGNHGTLENAAWTAGGKFGGALAFNGTNAKVSIPDAGSLDLL